MFIDYDFGSCQLYVCAVTNNNSLVRCLLQFVWTPVFEKCKLSSCSHIRVKTLQVWPSFFWLKTDRNYKSGHLDLLSGDISHPFPDAGPYPNGGCGGVTLPIVWHCRQNCVRRQNGWRGSGVTTRGWGRLVSFLFMCFSLYVCRLLYLNKFLLFTFDN